MITLPDAVDVAVRLHDRAIELQDCGRYRRAEQSCRRALRLLEQACGDSNPDVANVLNTLGGIQEIWPITRARSSRTGDLWRS